MADIRTIQLGSVFDAVTMDWLLTPAGELDATEELATAVRIALCTDRRANDEDELPNPDSDDRRGWWGDTDTAEIWGGWPIGSRLWLLARAKITGSGARQGSTTARVEDYAREAMQPFIDKGIASKLDVVATRVGLDRIDLAVTIYRGPRSFIQLRFEDLWNPVAGVAAPPPLGGFNDGFDDQFA